MEVQTVQIADLHLDPANVRIHRKRNIEAIKNSLSRFGQQKPIVIDKGKTVIAGNGTVAAAKELGWTEVDAVSTDIEGPEAIAFAIADNRTAELADWDTNALAKMLKADGIGEVGFTRREIQLMIDKMEAAAADRPECEITAELFERHDYLVVVFDNEMDWNVATQKLGVGTVKQKHNGETKFDKFGIGRVVTAGKLLECLK